MSRLKKQFETCQKHFYSRDKEDVLKDDVTFGVSTKQAPHCLAWAVLAGRFGRLAGNRSGRGSSKKLHKNLFVFERSCVLARAASLLLQHCTGGLLS